MVSSKWICKIDYVVDRSKERLVAIGFYQKEGINSEETLTLGSKVHFLQNYDGSCFHDEVKTILPLWYDWGRVLHRKDLKLKTDGLIYVS